MSDTAPRASGGTGRRALEHLVARAGGDPGVPSPRRTSRIDASPHGRPRAAGRPPTCRDTSVRPRRPAAPCWSPPAPPCRLPRGTASVARPRRPDKGVGRWARGGTDASGVRRPGRRDGEDGRGGAAVREGGSGHPAGREPRATPEPERRGGRARALGRSRSATGSRSRAVGPSLAARRSGSRGWPSGLSGGAARDAPADGAARRARRPGDEVPGEPACPPSAGSGRRRPGGPAARPGARAAAHDDAAEVCPGPRSSSHGAQAATRSSSMSACAPAPAGGPRPAAARVGDRAEAILAGEPRRRAARRVSGGRRPLAMVTRRSPPGLGSPFGWHGCTAGPVNAPGRADRPGAMSCGHGVVGARTDERGPLVVPAPGSPGSAPASRSANPARELTPSLSCTRCRWWSPVCGDTPSWAAVSLAVVPPVTAQATSASRAARPKARSAAGVSVGRAGSSRISVRGAPSFPGTRSADTRHAAAPLPERTTNGTTRTASSSAASVRPSKRASHRSPARGAARPRPPGLARKRSATAFASSMRASPSRRTTPMPAHGRALSAARNHAARRPARRWGTRHSSNVSSSRP